MGPVYEAAATTVINQTRVTVICCLAPGPQSISHRRLEEPHIQFVSPLYMHIRGQRELDGERQRCKELEKDPEIWCFSTFHSVVTAIVRTGDLVRNDGRRIRRRVGLGGSQTRYLTSRYLS